MDKKYIEENLNTPLRDILEKMQEQSLKSTYLGIRSIKSPIDFWIYQETIHKIGPDIIIEIGNKNGGTTLALAHILDNMNKDGKVIGIDTNHDDINPRVRNHPKIKLITGDACESFNKVKQIVGENKIVLIIEDSSHTYENTLKILKTFSPLISKNSYFIIEDSICHHGLDVGPNPGPYEAIEEFISNNDSFIIDRNKEKFVITWNPKGYLKKIK